jgi:transposase
MLRQKLIADLDPWIVSASVSLIVSFARGITKDKEAVRTAITEPWSNGQTEGQITKLKGASKNSPFHEPVRVCCLTA